MLTHNDMKLRVENFNWENVNLVAGRILSDPRASRIHFTKIDSEKDWVAVNQFRLNMYKQKLNYMLSELDADGSSQYDSNSYIFAAWLDNEIIATIRLTKYPFETLKYISEDSLKNFLGNEWRQTYLEWTRLIIDTSKKVKNLTQALTIFAGLTVLNTTHFTAYFGYTKSAIRRLFSSFAIAQDKIPLKIPHRGAHTYYLLKGSFLTDFQYLFVR